MKGLWKPGVVTNEDETPRSYRVKIDDGGEYRTNRRMLLKSAELDSVAEDILTDETPSTRIRNTPLPENVEIHPYLMKPLLNRVQFPKLPLHLQKSEQPREEE